MSFSITEAFVEQFKAGFTQRVQQMGSRLRENVRVESQFGKASFYDFIGATTVRERTVRHGDSPYIETPHSRRMCTLRDFDWGDYVDQEDKIRTLNDPTNPYVVAAAMSMGRKIDELIIAAFDADVDTGEDGGTPVAFALDGGTYIDHGTGGADGASALTMDLVAELRTTLDGNEASENDDLVLVVGYNQVQNMLTEEQFTSADYMTVKALVAGEIDSVCGFKVVRVNDALLPHEAGTDTTIFAYAKSKMLLALGQDVKARISEREDKGYSTYAFTSMSIGAVRMQGEGVIKMDLTNE